MKDPCLFGALILALQIAGCSETTSSFSPYSQARLQNVTSQEIQEVYKAAEETMQEYFSLAVADSRAHVLRSAPTTNMRYQAGGPLGRSLSSPGQIRRIAELRIEQQRGGVVAYCSVTIQQSDTAERRAFASQSSIDDTPDQTPLEESQGLDDERYMTWSTKGSDRKLERELLAALQERVSRLRNR